MEFDGTEYAFGYNTAYTTDASTTTWFVTHSEGEEGVTYKHTQEYGGLSKPSNEWDKTMELFEDEL